jgi:hypothetical protein
MIVMKITKRKPNPLLQNGSSCLWVDLIDFCPNYCYDAIYLHMKINYLMVYSWKQLYLRCPSLSNNISDSVFKCITISAKIHFLAVMSSDTSSYVVLLKFQLSPNWCHHWGTICNSYIPVSYRIHEANKKNWFCCS